MKFKKGDLVRWETLGRVDAKPFLMKDRDLGLVVERHERLPAIPHDPERGFDIFWFRIKRKHYHSSTGSLSFIHFVG